MSDTRSTTLEPKTADLVLYALPALPLALMMLPFFVMVPEFYAREMGLPLAAVGTALLLIRAVDAMSDPLIGWLCDRSRPSFGRRRLWLLIATPFMIISTLLLFVPPEKVTVTYLLLTGVALSVTWTALQVPYLAWGAELSPSEYGRTRVAAFREGVSVTGTLLALVIPAALSAYGFIGSRTAMSVYAGIIAIGLPLFMAALIWRIPEPALPTAFDTVSSPKAPQKTPLWRVFCDEKSYRQLTLAFFINGFANGLPATLFLLFVADKLGNREVAGPLLVLYFTCGIAGVPLWLWLSKRVGKSRSWCYGMMLASLSFIGALFLGEGDVLAFGIVCILTGLAVGGDFILPASLQADLIEQDTAQHGTARAGQFIGIWTFASKLAFAGAVGFAFPLLSASGYDPGLNIKSPQGLMMLGVLYAGLPVILKVGAIALMWSFENKNPSPER
jgi:glycoside/pentoside/hexuronide:cation symporter, GPH family